MFPRTPREQAGSSGRNWGTLERLLLGMPQRHYLLGPSSHYPSQWGFFCPYSSLCQKNRPMKTVGCFRWLWRGFLGTFFPLLFPPVLKLSLPGLEPDQNPGCPAQALRSYCKNSVRDSDKWEVNLLGFREKRPFYRVWATECGLASFWEQGWMHMLMSGRIIPAIGEPPTPLSFDSALELFCHLWVCLLGYRLGIKVYLNLTCHLGPNWF